LTAVWRTFAQDVWRSCTANACRLDISISIILTLPTGTYDSARQKQQRRQAVNRGHDETWYSVDEASGNADQGNEDTEAASEGAIGGGGGWGAICLPLDCLYGETKDDSAEDDPATTTLDVPLGWK
jgi:hypothetical protein